METGEGLGEHNEKEAGFALKRTEAGREYKKLKGAFDVLEPVENPPEKEVQSSELFAELDKARRHNQGIDDKSQSVEFYEGEIEKKKSLIDEREKQIEEWRYLKNLAESNIKSDIEEIYGNRFPDN